MNALPPQGPKFTFFNERRFTTAQWKSLFMCQETIMTTCLKYGLDHILVGTLTFPALQRNLWVKSGHLRWQ